MTAKELAAELTKGHWPSYEELWDYMVPLIEADREEQWQLGYDLGWKNCEDQKAWDHVSRNL